MSDARNWDQGLDSTQQLPEVTRGIGPTKGWPDLRGNMAVNLVVLPRAVPLPNLGNPEVYLDFPLRMLDFAVSPHLSRHPRAAAAGLGGRKEA